MLRSEVIKVKKISELDELKSIKGYESSYLLLSYNSSELKNNYNIKINNFLKDIVNLINDTSISQEDIVKEILTKSLQYININTDDYIIINHELTNNENNIPSINIDTSIKLSKFNETDNSLTNGIITGSELSKILNNKWEIL